MVPVRGCFYRRKRLIIFLSVQVMGCSVSADCWQILSRVTDELNKLGKKDKNWKQFVIMIVLIYLNIFKKKKKLSDHPSLKLTEWECVAREFRRKKKPRDDSQTGFTWKEWHLDNRSWCGPESPSYVPLAETALQTQGLEKHCPQILHMVELKKTKTKKTYK